MEKVHYNGYIYDRQYKAKGLQLCHLPFYTKDNTRGNKPKNINGNFMWIFGKMYK